MESYGKEQAGNIWPSTIRIFAGISLHLWKRDELEDLSGKWRTGRAKRRVRIRERTINKLPWFQIHNSSDVQFPNIPTKVA